MEGWKNSIPNLQIDDTFTLPTVDDISLNSGVAVVSKWKIGDKEYNPGQSIILDKFILVNGLKFEPVWVASGKIITLSFSVGDADADKKYIKITPSNADVAYKNLMILLLLIKPNLNQRMGRILGQAGIVLKKVRKLMKRKNNSHPL